MLIVKSLDDDLIHVSWGSGFSMAFCLARTSVPFRLPDEVRSKECCEYCFRTSGLYRAEGA
jgi:hypothetical protein